jgi:hypothetical protein
MCSAIMIVVRFVFARGTSGIMDASTTRNPSVPSTRHSGSTTDRWSSGAPIQHVPQACQNSRPSVSSHASSRLSSANAVGLRPVVPTETAWTRSVTVACCANVKVGDHGGTKGANLIKVERETTGPTLQCVRQSSWVTDHLRYAWHTRHCAARSRTRLRTSTPLSLASRPRSARGHRPETSPPSGGARRRPRPGHTT